MAEIEDVRAMTEGGEDAADRRVERHSLRAWDADSGGPLVLDSYGGLIAASLVGTVRGVEGNDVL